VEPPSDRRPVVQGPEPRKRGRRIVSQNKKQRRTGATEQIGVDSSDGGAGGNKRRRQTTLPFRPGEEVKG
jgi:hypothetical protein